MLPYGEVWIGVDEDDVVSVALWMPPSTASPASVLNEIAIEQATLEGARHEASVKAETFVSRLRPTTAHYYLGAVGTRRDRQQRGHGAAVPTPMLDRADAEDAQVFLETSAIENVHFYLGLGDAARRNSPGLLVEIPHPGGG